MDGHNSVFTDYEVKRFTPKGRVFWVNVYDGCYGRLNDSLVEAQRWTLVPPKYRLKIKFRGAL